MVTIREKKDFLDWVLKTQTFARRESVWILNYLMGREQLLRKIRFVSREYGMEMSMYRVVMMTTYDSEHPPFKFFKENVMTTDAEKAFHDIRLNRDETLYVVLDYTGIEKCPEWYGVLDERTPDSPDVYTYEFKDLSPSLDNPNMEYRYKNSDTEMCVESLLDTVIYEKTVNDLQQKIDLALSTGDKEGFMALSETLTEIKQLQPKKFYKTIKERIHD